MHDIFQEAHVLSLDLCNPEHSLSMVGDQVDAANELDSLSIIHNGHHAMCGLNVALCKRNIGSS
jgi:hypothetical protein